MSTDLTRLLIALGIANLVLVGIALGWLAWISAHPPTGSLAPTRRMASRATQDLVVRDVRPDPLAL